MPQRLGRSDLLQRTASKWQARVLLWRYHDRDTSTAHDRLPHRAAHPASHPRRPDIARGLRAWSRVRRATVFGVCILLVTWSWWEAKTGGYAGLPVNTLGQILGDLLLMGIAAPFVSLRRRRHIPRGTKPLTLVQALAQGQHRIQLLDVDICLPQLALGARSPTAPESARSDHRALASALKSALENNACIEILLPDPDAPAGYYAAHSLGIDPEEYRRSLRNLVDDLTALPSSAHSGRLDLRVYAEPASVSIVRCDGRIWASLHPPGAAYGNSYLAFEQACDNTRVLQSYFADLHASARSAVHTHRGAARRCPQARQPLEGWTRDARHGGFGG